MKPSLGKSALGLLLCSPIVFSVGCLGLVEPGDGEDGSGGRGAGGSSTSVGGPRNTWAGFLFDDSGVWVSASENTVGIQGAFRVAYDGLKNGEVVVDELQHSQVNPESFSEETSRPCISGTLGPVTASDGRTECGFSAGDPECDWATWGADIVLTLNETGGAASVSRPWNAVAYGVTGFDFDLSIGTFQGMVRFSARMEGSTGEFCKDIHEGQNTVELADLVHGCWGSDGTEVLDLSRLTELRWQLVTSPGTEFPFHDFCLDSLWFY